VAPAGILWLHDLKEDPMDTTMTTPPTALGADRAALYACFTRARDALFDLCDALATDPGARSFVALSQAPCFQRRWPSVYEALEDGQIDRTALRALFEATVPRSAAGARTVLDWTAAPSCTHTCAQPRIAPWCMCPPQATCGAWPCRKARPPRSAPLLVAAKSGERRKALRVGKRSLVMRVKTRCNAGTVAYRSS